METGNNGKLSQGQKVKQLKIKTPKASTINGVGESHSPTDDGFRESCSAGFGAKPNRITYGVFLT